MKTVIICSPSSSETCTIFFLWNTKRDLAQKFLKLETVKLQKRQSSPCKRNKSIILKSLPCLFIFKPGASTCIAPVLKSKMSVNRIYLWLYPFFFPYLVVFQRSSWLFFFLQVTLLVVWCKLLEIGVVVLSASRLFSIDLLGRTNCFTLLFCSHGGPREDVY